MSYLVGRLESGIQACVLGQRLAMLMNISCNHDHKGLSDRGRYKDIGLDFGTATGPFLRTGAQPRGSTRIRARHLLVDI